MTRFSAGTVFVLLSILFLVSDADSQTVATAPVITGSSSPSRVRFVAPANIVRIRLEVLSESGESLVDVSSKGNIFDWTLQDGGGSRIADGTYVCLVTVKSLGGKLSQRMGVVSVEKGRVGLQTKSIPLTAAQQQAIGPVEENAALTVLPDNDIPTATVVAHDGVNGQVTASTGDLTFRTGDVFSGTETERMRITEDGKVGIGTDKPEAELDVAGELKARKGFTFFNGSTLNVNENGGLSVTKADGTIAPEVSGTGTSGRLTKWADGASGALGDSVVLDTGTGLQLTALPNAITDTNVLFTNGNDRTTGAIASSSSSFQASNGPYFALRGNAYAAIANQRGLFAFSAGNVSSPVGNEGSIVMLTGSDQVRMIVKPNGNVGIGTTTPAFKFDVAGNIRSVFGASNDIQVETTGGTNTWARFSVKSPNQRWVFGTSQNFNGDQLYLYDDSWGFTRMTIQPNNGAVSFPSGSVGIGTGSPTARLDVRGGNTLTGIYGESAVPHTITQPGVFGVSTGDGGVGVIGEANIGNTWGVAGRTTSVTGIGVYGFNSAGGTAVYSQGAAVVNGSLTTAGLANFNGNVTVNANISTSGHVSQSRDQSGFPKAMISVNGNNGTIARCFNGTTGQSLSGGTAVTGCGFTLNNFATGFYQIDLGFQVDDRFAVVSSNGQTTMANVRYGPAGPNTLTVYMYYIANYQTVGAGTNDHFTLIVY